MSAHTPGPWRERGGFIIGSDESSVCWVSKNHRESATIESNARLIAAAPELRAALEAVSLDVAAKHLRADVWVQVENVVKKARGE